MAVEPATASNGGAAKPKLRSRKDGAAIPLDDADKRLMNLLQSRFPLAAEPFVPVAAEAELELDDVMERTARLVRERIIREITPDLRHPRAGLRVDAGRGEGRLTNTPTARRRSSTRTPGVSPQLPAHPRVQPLVHDRDPARLGAGPPGHAGRAAGADRRRVDPPAADAAPVQDQHEPGDGEGHRRAGRHRRGRAAARARGAALRRHRHRGDQGAPGADGGRRPPVRRGRRRGRDEHRGASWPTWRGCVERKILRRVAAILFHRRAGFSANGMGVWRVPDEKVLETRGADGGGPRRLPLLRAPDLRGLAVLGLHHGPRPLEGGVRRDPRLDRRRARPPRRRSRRPLLLDRVQEDPPPLLHGRLRGVGSGPAGGDRRSRRARAK